MLTTDGNELVSQVVKTPKDPRGIQILDVDRPLASASRSDELAHLVALGDAPLEESVSRSGISFSSNVNGPIRTLIQFLRREPCGRRR